MVPKLNCILLVDDDRLTNFLHKIIIDNSGIADHVERSTSAQTALSYLSSSLQKNPTYPVPDLIFLDMRMPEQSGWKFIDYFKLIKNDFEKQPVIIMLSSVGDAKDISTASNLAEVAGFYLKPLTPELLNEVVTEYC